MKRLEEQADYCAIWVSSWYDSEGKYHYNYEKVSMLALNMADVEQYCLDWGKREGKKVEIYSITRAWLPS